MYQVRVLYLPYKCRQTKRHIQTSFYPSLSIHSQGRGFLEQENIEKKGNENNINKEQDLAT